MAGERILPGLGLMAGWDLGSHLWADGMESNLQSLSAVAQLSVKSRTTTIPIGGPDGEIYIIPVGDPNQNMVAVRDEGAWNNLDPKTGWTAFVEDTGKVFRFDGADWVDTYVPPHVRNSLADTDTIQLGDAGGTVQVNSATAVAVTIPLNSSVPIPIGVTVVYLQRGPGQLSFSGEAGVTVLHPAILSPSSSGQYASVGLLKVEADVWYVTGDLVQI